MKRKNFWKIFLVSLLGIVVTTGCSCTSSMCSDKDIRNIKTQIESKNVDNWRQSFSVEHDKSAYDDGFITYFNKCLEDKGNGCVIGMELDQVVAARKMEEAFPGQDYSKDNPELEGYVKTRTPEFNKFVNDSVNNIFAKHSQACLTMKDRTDPETGATIEAKTWVDAWKTGLLEGLIVFPLAWLMDALTYSFGGNGGAQLLAIFLSVFIIRLIMLLMNFKGQIGNIRMQELQPEIMKLQSKFNDPNLSETEKQKLSMKMMDLYKKNDIHPFSTFITSFIQFPIFLAVWAAMNQTLAIRSGNLFGLEFGEKLSDQIFKGNWAAIVLFILMIIGQVLTMELPTIINKFRNRKNKNKQSSTPKSMNWMMLIMMVLVILSGFLLPAALVIYWVLGSLFSIIQTLIFSSEPVKNKLKSIGNRKKKAKVVR